VQAVVGEAAVLHGHGGSIDGFNALYRYVSGTGRGYAVLGNVDPIPAGVVALLDAAIAQGTGLEARAAATAVPAARVPAAFAGTYQPIAHRNRLMPLVAGLTRFVRVDVAGDALSIDGQPRIVGPALTLRRPERVAPTQVLVRTEEGPELLGGTEALRKVPSWTVQAKAAFGILAALSLLLALGVLVVALVRRRASWAAVAGVLAFVPPVALLVMLGTVMSMHASDQLVLFGQASWLSVGVFVLSLLIPAGGLLALHGALRGRGVARWSAALAAGVVLVATVHLALHGWIGLRTWAL
jgi:hypothetical protein